MSQNGGNVQFSTTNIKLMQWQNVSRNFLRHMRNLISKEFKTPLS